MAINSTQKYQGYVLATIARAVTGQPGIYLSLQPGDDRSAYVFNCVSGERSMRLGVYIKISTSRRSPWKYTFLRYHQEVVKKMNEVCDATYIVFVNDDDGIACIDHQELKELLDDKFDDVEWISVARKLNESYKLNGKDGELSSKTKQGAFPELIVKAVTSYMNDSSNSLIFIPATPSN